MAESNGEIPLTGDPRVDAALQRIRGKFQDLEDAMVVQAHLEKGIVEQQKRHKEAIQAHDEWMVHFQEKLDALTDIMMQRGGGPEA